MTPSPPRPSSRRWLGLLTAALSLLPAVLALQEPAGAYEGESAMAARARVLSAMPSDAAVLINVSTRELPASPDILNLGKRSTRALERCLSDNVDASVRWQCADLLAALGDASALPTLRAALDDWDASVRGAVIRALARIPDAASFEPLQKTYRRADEEPGNRSAVLHAMGALGSRPALQFARAEFQKGGPMRGAALAAVWRSRHLMARTTLEGDLTRALESGEHGLVLFATDAAAELRSPALSRPLVALVEHQDVEIRNKAVYALGRIGDPTAIKALQERIPQVREARMLNNIAFALERLDPKAFLPAARGLIEHKQAIIRLNAAFVLGDVGRPEGRPLLEKALQDPSDYVRTSAVVALGKLGAPEAAPALERFVDDPNPVLREEALFALFALSPQGRRDQLHQRAFTGARDDGVRRRAALALVAVDDPRVRDYALTCLERWSCTTRQVGDYLVAHGAGPVGERLLLGFAQGRIDFAPLVARTRPAGALPIALATASAGLDREDHSAAAAGFDMAGDLGDASAAPRLAPHGAHARLLLRTHANVALARLGDASADARLLADLDGAPVDWLPRLASLLGLVREPAVQQRLRPELERRATGHTETALAAARVLLAWDAEKAFPRLLAGLAADSVRERELASAALAADRRDLVTSLLRRALAREARPFVKDRLRMLTDGRP